MARSWLLRQDPRLAEVVAKLAGTLTLLLIAHEDGGIPGWTWPVVAVLKAMVIAAVLQDSLAARRASGALDVAIFLLIAGATTSRAAQVAVFGGLVFLMLRQDPTWALGLGAVLVSGDIAAALARDHETVALVLAINGGWILPVLWAASIRRESHARRLAELEHARTVIYDELTSADAQARLTLGADVHDGPLQLLAAASQDLADLPGEDAARARTNVRDAMTELRQILRGSTQDNSREQVETMLRSWLTILAARNGFDWMLNIEAGIERVGPVATASTRELVTNAAKHAGAQLVTADITSVGNALRVEVRDDGVGLPDDSEDGFGLSTLRRRIELLGGTLTLSPGPDGRGTRAVAHVPVVRR